MKNLLLTFLCTACTLIAASAQNVITVKSAKKNIIGTWISTQNENWKLVFTADNTCTQYYDTTVQERDTVIIAIEIPACGPIENAKPTDCYLQLIDKKNPGANHTCYIIKAVNDKLLGIHPFKSNGSFVFTKAQ